MQKIDSNKYLFLPSDLTTFLACHHVSFLDVKSLSEDLTKKERDSSSKLLQEKGIEHEKTYLQKLKIEGKSICEIDPNLPINDRIAKTIEALKDGYDVIWGQKHEAQKAANSEFN